MQRVFIDESGTSDSRYLVIGSLWGHETALDTLNEELERVLARHFPNRRELKWRKISQAKLPGYLEVIDAFTNAIGTRFRCIVLDVSKIDHDKFNSGDKDLGYYKFVYQLICKGIQKDFQLFAVNDRYLVYHDNVSAALRQATRLSDLKDVLNNTTSLIIGSKSINPVRDIQSIDSKDSTLLQVADIMTGAVRHAFDKAGDYSTSSPWKKAVIEHVQNRINIRSLSEPTSYGREKFNIWQFKLS